MGTAQAPAAWMAVEGDFRAAERGLRGGALTHLAEKPINGLCGLLWALSCVGGCGAYHIRCRGAPVLGLGLDTPRHENADLGGDQRREAVVAHP